MIASAATKHIHDVYSRLDTGGMSSPLLVFMTVTFSTRSSFTSTDQHALAPIDEMRPAYLIKQFERLYRHTISALIGKSFNRSSKKHLQPLVWMFVDHPASKNVHRYRRKVKQAHWHIHAVWCVHPDVAPQFNAMITSGFFDAEIHRMGTPFEGVDVQIIDKDDLARVVPYSAALLRQPSKHDPDNLYALLPTSRSEHQGSTLVAITTKSTDAGPTDAPIPANAIGLALDPFGSMLPTWIEPRSKTMARLRQQFWDAFYKRRAQRRALK